MDPITHLLDEHARLREALAPLGTVVAALAARGDAALAEAMPVLARAGHLLETALAAHARKEEEALFPALERVIGAVGGPTAVMRREHEAIHAQGALLRQTLRELNEVDHPRIEAGTAGLRERLAAGGSAQEFHALAVDLLDLIEHHFGKEEHVLFPMARQILASEELDVVARMMVALETEPDESREMRA